jgi:hypothetical protein
MNYLEELKHSAMVRNPIEVGKIDNIHGKYWACIGYYVLGLHDLRPRMGTFTNPWGAVSNPVFAAPKLRHINVSLSDLMDQRACELLEISARENRPLALMWSGGIDSTGVLSALIKNATNTEQIHVYCSQKSILENPVFYKNHISGKLKCGSIRELDVTEELIDSTIILHGDPGDCLFGPSMPMYAHLVPSGDHHKPWKDQRGELIKGIENNRSIPGFAEWYVNKISDNIQEVDAYNIHSVSEWWWWHYFNLKWEFSLLRPFFETRKSIQGTISQQHLQSYADTSFYNTDDFQSWSYSNLHRLFIDQKHHKQDLKQYIYELDRNEFYKTNKAKTVSIAGITGQRPMMLNKDLRAYTYWDKDMKAAIRDQLESYTG